jgi:thiosulfate/3-mercaptopyruvate sulfurtransferase
MSPSALCLALSLLTTGADADAKPATYPKPDLLVEPADLMKPEAAEKFRILDARGKDKYQDGHIPGAVVVSPIAWAGAFGDGDDKDGWTKRIGELGINVDTKVVIYDDAQSKDAARIWWILRYWGVKDVRLLNGGWKGWTTANGKVEMKASEPKAVEPKLVAQSDRRVSKKEIMDLLKEKPPQLVDARSSGEFCGTEETAKRNGAIPGAKNLEWSDLLDKKTGRFKSAEELGKLFQDAGIDPKKPAMTYCQSGGRASVMAFALELMGGQDVRNYYRSWAEWGNAEDTPIVKPKK